MVNVLVMSRKEAERYSHSPHDEESAVISISTPDEQYDMNIYGSIYNGIKRILRLSFDDVDRGSLAMTEGDAASIAEFVEKNKDKTLIVHCDAGISRSAGIAAAIMKHYNGDDTKIFNSRLYCPNMLCYRMVLRQFEGEIIEKERDCTCDEQREYEAAVENVEYCERYEPSYEANTGAL